jgi:predicted MFS family arabinose efflux permease
VTVELTRARERWLLLALGGVQFSAILDFMLLMPLGPQLMRLFDITPTEFGVLVSVYMATASTVGFAAALVIDRFDRRATLLVLYGCFTLTTLVTASAQSYTWLLAARAAAGAFAGVLIATVLAIVGDTIPDGRRGRALGAVMSSGSIASIVGIPLGIWLASHFSWRAPFFFDGLLCAAVLAAAAYVVPRVRAHVEAARRGSALARARAVFGRANHIAAFGITTLLNFSAFAIVPFVAAYFVLNVGISERELTFTFFFGGAAALVFVRLVGRLTDLHGRRRVFALVAGLSIVAIFVVTHLPRAPLWGAVAAQMLLMSSFAGRFVPAMTIVTGAVAPEVRGIFMSFNSAFQQLSAGLASLAAAAIVVRGAGGELLHFGAVGWLSMVATLAAIALAAHVRPAAAT